MRNGGPHGPAEIHLHDGADADAFLRWLVASGAVVDSFERVSTPLEDIFVRVAEQAEIVV